ncbi:TetR/AcrR family transcriptional regulator [Terribacillus saccharophilus]|uniref:TetR/AcrR family transcriptional regulator n=1 Tax=Terribacillus saccharophilus TaxID=361277 RepID=UPI002989E86B|nr:TetR/AcrR family transcriptional regulator [Terribacillus saccharophilus]MCM3224204.1 TetR/AcrR family transcriptional regulator [Terribacillus saccharophilus]
MPRMQLSKAMIIDTALSLAEQQGYEAVTMANIARSLTIKPPSLYNHFKNLDEIKYAMAEAVQKQLYEALKDTEKDAQPLLSLAKAYVHFGSSHPGLYASSLPGGTGEVSEKLVKLIADGLTAFSLDETEKIHAIRGFRSMLHGFIDLNKHAGFKLDVNLEKSLEQMVGIYVRGLQT